MFENPHMIYELSKQRQEELLEEYLQMQRAKSLMKKKDKTPGRTGNIVLAFADFLIKTGICLKKRWTAKAGKAC